MAEAAELAAQLRAALAGDGGGSTPEAAPLPPGRLLARLRSLLAPPAAAAARAAFAAADGPRSLLTLVAGGGGGPAASGDAAAASELLLLLLPRRSAAGGSSGAATALRLLLSALEAGAADGADMRHGNRAAGDPAPAAAPALSSDWLPALQRLLDAAAAAAAGGADGRESGAGGAVSAAGGPEWGGPFEAPEAIEPLCSIVELLAVRAGPGTPAGGLVWRLHPLQLLLRLHDGVRHGGGEGGKDAACCSAARRALLSFERVCERLAPTLRGRRASSGALVGELCSDLHATVQRLAAACPSRAVRRLAWDGSVSGFEQRPCASDPCCISGFGTISGDSGGGSGTVLEAALGALRALVAAAGAPAAAALRARDLAATLRALCGFNSPRVLAGAQRLCGAAAAACPRFRDDALADCGGAALAGVLRFAAAAAGGSGRAAASAAAARLAAAERLCAAVDGLSGRDFGIVSGAAGALPAYGPERAAAERARGGGRGGGAEVPGCALAAAHAVVAGALSRKAPGDDAGGGGGRSGGEALWEAGTSTPQLLEACGQLLLASLDRSRRAAGLPRAAAPRSGFWRALPPAAVLRLEERISRPRWLATRPTTAAGAECAGGAPPAAPDPAAAAVAALGGSPPVQCDPKSSHRDTAAPDKAGSASGSKRDPASDGARAVASDDAYDEDGLRVAWDSGPGPEARAARAAWRAVPLARLVAWQQSSRDVEVHFTLPPGTSKKDLAVIIAPDRVTVCLSWAGRVLDSPLHARVRASDAVWALDAAGGGPAGLLPAAPPLRGAAGGGGGEAAAADGRDPPGLPSDCASLMIVLPKALEGSYWKALFEGGPEKSHWELLHEAVHNEDDARAPGGGGAEAAGPEAAALLGELLERQRLVAEGALDLETSFDDFRLVVGDASL
ncbi:hypothetical protein Rsub_08321 [Raphidocelis subcapitata]|uniref:CS domain-containing protein n=1 Tax=Raphidocelis subcapitata TaxID=307507 RepID=A0A2V0PBM7_9CHLO|nr:hypothetical protein Rsub_08321 [Raphidocelis subcapitata]|eukprot:GBF95290.1 hypothetical protein Rsub_08321 [Raphidocelis subcapitata]